MLKNIILLNLLLCSVAYADATQAATMAGVLMVIGFVVAFVFRLIGKVFSKTKRVVNETIKSDIKPFIKEKQQNYKEEKILKLKNLLDNDIISEEEYKKRRERIEQSG